MSRCHYNFVNKGNAVTIQFFGGQGIMIDNTKEQYNHYLKMAWIIYSLLTLIIIAVLVLFVAQDNEERFFYGIMPAAAAYVFRPMHKPFSKLIFRFTGASLPTTEEK